MTQAVETGAPAGRGDAWRALAIFCAAALGLAAAYLASALLFADLGAFLAADGSPARLPHFNAALGLVFSCLCAALWLGQRWAHHDLEVLHGVAEAGEAAWSRWAERVRTPAVVPLGVAVLLGAAAGVAVGFTLFLLVPLGSWLGGALAGRIVERWLGA